MRLYVIGVIIFILYVVVSILSVQTIQQYVTTHRDNLLWTSLDEVLSEADNGDILLWSSNTKIIQYASDCPFTHISMVFRDYDKGSSGPKCLYCWEADLGQKYRSGPRIIRLRDKLERYKGSPIMGWKALSKGGRPTSDQLLKIASSYLDYTMDIYILGIRWLISRVLMVTPCGGGKVQKFLHSKIFEQVVCSELIAETLQQIGILEYDPPASQYAPADWLYNNLNCTTQNTYGPTYFFRSKKNSNILY